MGAGASKTTPLQPLSSQSRVGSPSQVGGVGAGASRSRTRTYCPYPYFALRRASGLLAPATHLAATIGNHCRVLPLLWKHETPGTAQSLRRHTHPRPQATMPTTMRSIMAIHRLLLCSTVICTRSTYTAPVVTRERLHVSAPILVSGSPQITWALWLTVLRP